MDARTWAIAKALLADAAGRPAAEQAAFIEAHCRDAVLRAELLAMLAAPAPISEILAQPTLRSGVSLGGYVIEDLIGRGGMGEVYRARDTCLSRAVAIKVLPSAVSGDPASLDRLEREAHVLAAVNHPHIATIHDLGNADGTSFLVMELVDGVTLAERLTKGRLKQDDALALAIDVAEALEAAHRAGVVHRDLKPGNVMLGKNGLKLLDFGLAKATGPVAAAGAEAWVPSAGTLSATSGRIVGTLPYMAPEQVEGRPVDARTDIFAFGALLYEMLTGRAPFVGRTPAEMIAAILDRQPAPLTPTDSPVRPGLARLIERCLAKDPDERWQTATDLLSELRWVREARDLPTASTRAIDRAWLGWVVALFSVAAAASVVLWAWRSRVATDLPVMRTVVQPPEGRRFLGPLAFSRDGRKLAFGTVAKDQYVDTLAINLWIYSFEDGTSRPVPDSEGAVWPFFSPDGRQLGFCMHPDSLRIVELSSGKATTVATGGCTEAAWSADGTIAFIRSGALYEMRDSYSAPALSVSPPQDVTFELPSFLPDGRHVLVTASSSGSTPFAAVHVADRQTHSARMLLPDVYRARYAASGFILYRSVAKGAQGNVMAQPFDAQRLALSGSARVVATNAASYAVSDQQVLAYYETDQRDELIWVDRDGESEERLALPVGASPLHPRISPNGDRLAYENNVSDSDGQGVWIHDLVHDTATRLSSDNDSYPIWSFDGRELLVGRDGSQLIRKDAAGGGGDHVVLQGARVSAMDWAPDGREIIYGQGDGVLRVWKQTSPSSGTSEALNIRKAWDAAFSPNREWIAYTSNESGRVEVYVAGYPTGMPRKKISPDGGAQAVWRQDGRELFYIASDKRMMSVSVDPRSREHPFGEATELFKTRISSTSDISYHVTPDGQRFIMSVVKQTAPVVPLQIVTNWTSLLGR